MKLNAQQFVKAVKVLKKVILPAAKTNKPILKAVRITQGKNKLSFAATDLENGVEIDLATECEAAAPVLVSFEIIEKTSKAVKVDVESIKLEREGEEITVSVKSLNIAWRTDEYLIEDYPLLDFPTKAQLLVANLSGEDIVDTIAKVTPAIATGDKQYSLGGMCINTTAKFVDFVCTDTFRLHRKRFDRKRGKVYKGIIRVSGVNILKSLAAVSGKVKMYACKSPKFPTMVMTGESIRMKTMLIESRYPSYENIIPHDLPVSVTGNTKAFMAALQDLTPFVNKENHAIDLSRDESGHLVLKALEAELQVSECKHSGLSMPFKLEYLMDVLRQVDADYFEMKICQDEEGGVLRLDDAGVIYIVSNIDRNKINNT